jgi:hypothetical protein
MFWSIGTPTVRRLLAGSLAPALLIGCGNGTVTPTVVDSGSADTVDSKGADAGKTDVTTDASPGDGTDIPSVTEDFWVVYSRRDRNVAGGTPKPSDLVLASWKNPGAVTNAGTFGIGASPLDPAKPAIELTKFSFKQAGNLSCANGCFLSRDMHFIAVATEKPTATGYTFQLASVSDQLQVFVGKFGKIKDVAHLEFAANAEGTFLFYSTPTTCGPTGKCQYDIHRLGPLGDENGGDTVITKMAPDEDPDVQGNDTTYNGFFRVSANGATMTFLTTTIRSLRLYMWHESVENGVKTASVSHPQDGYICENPVGDSCVGTGSQYHDSDPIAISPEGNTVLLFTIVDRWLRVRKYKLGTEEASVFSDLVEVAPGTTYLQSVCDAIKAKPWQLAQVKDQPQFSADGKSVYFLGYAECPKGGIQKKWTDIIALPVDKIGSKIGQEDWHYLTHNPRDDSTANKVIGGFSLSPQRQVLILSATASLQQSGTPIPDGQDRAKTDTELYSLVIGDSKMVEITNELTFAADAPQTVLPVVVK